MQLFVRDPAGRTTAYTAASPLELQEQVFASLSEASSHARLSYRSRTLPNLQHVATNFTDNSSSSPSSSSFADYAIGPYATIDLSFRLRGGGPKKRCAHVSVKTSSSSNTPSTSGTATPSSSSGIVSKPTVATTAPSPAANPDVGADSNKKDGNVDGNNAMQVDDSEKKEDGTTVTVTPAPSTSEATTAATTTTVGPTSVVPLNNEPILERCSNAALRMVGECNQCNKNFCGNHRLPEDHACPALQNFRKAAFDENMKRLNKEATFTSKISAF